MRQLPGDDRLEDRVLSRLFLQRLLVNAQLILASFAGTAHLEQLASMVDKILQVSMPTGTVATLASPTLSLTSDNQDVSHLHCQVNNLTTQVHSRSYSSNLNRKTNCIA